MKKISLSLIVCLCVLGLSGCGKKEVVSENQDKQINSENSSLENNPEKKEISGEEGMLSKLKNAISSGKKMKCSYKMENENGATEIITYVQGDKYKTEINVGQIKNVSIFDGEVMYSWSSGQKQGFKMNMDCVKDLEKINTGDSAPEKAPVEDEEGFVDSLKDAKNLNCEDAGEVDFEIPSDINFTDQCEMLKSQQEMLKNLNN